MYRENPMPFSYLEVDMFISAHLFLQNIYVFMYSAHDACVYKIIPW